MTDDPRRWRKRADVPDDVVIAAVQEARRLRNAADTLGITQSTATREDVAAVLAGHPEQVGVSPRDYDYPEVPTRLLLAKLRHMIARGVLDGCPCGCRRNAMTDPHLYAQHWDDVGGIPPTDRPNTEPLLTALTRHSATTAGWTNLTDTHVTWHEDTHGHTTAAATLTGAPPHPLPAPTDTTHPAAPHTPPHLLTSTPDDVTGVPVSVPGGV